MKKLDKRRNYYLILDTETATLPFIKDDETLKKHSSILSIQRPLIYDLGYEVIDRKNRVYRKRNFLISEIFCNDKIFDTAYYKDKRPLYLRKIAKNEISLTLWYNAIATLKEDLEEVSAVGAYNAYFDFKKAIPFTQQYIDAYYTTDYESWEQKQKSICYAIVNKETKKSTKKSNNNIFSLDGIERPIFDIWNLSCKYLLNNNDYKDYCISNNYYNKYFTTNAETAFRYITKNTNFNEEHTALDDTEIEAEIFTRIIKKQIKNLELGINAFPFRQLGTVKQYIEK